MGYMDKLYKPENIIGYTGDLQNNPTVYFLTPSTNVNGQPKTKLVGKVNQILFLNGHITQAHGEATNIGREKVIESWSYSIMNAESKHDNTGLIKPGKKALQETFHSSEPSDPSSYYDTPDGFSDFHISRSTFTQVSFKDKVTLQTLALSIAKFPLIKKMYGNVADDEISYP